MTAFLSGSADRMYFSGCKFLDEADNRARSTSSRSVARSMDTAGSNRRMLRFLTTRSLIMNASPLMLCVTTYRHASVR